MKISRITQSYQTFSGELGIYLNGNKKSQCDLMEAGKIMKRLNTFAKGIHKPADAG